MHAPEPSDETCPAHPRWRFVALCLFLGSQCFTVPVLAIGPSWAVWPTLQDFAIALLGLVCILLDRSSPSLPPAHRKLAGWFALLFAACLLSFLYLTVLLPPAGVVPPERALGLFEIIRLAQFLIVFWATARIPLTPARIRLLHALVTGVLWLVCLGIFASFFHLIEPQVFIQHLPQDRGILGPWQDYGDDELARGWGAVGYNHAYVAAQVLVLLALQLQLRPRPAPVLTSASVVLTLAASFLSGSRAGFAATAAFVALTLLRRPALALLLLLFLLVFGSQMTLDDLPDDVQPVFETQRALSDPAEDDSLNGRAAIWERHADFLRANLWLLPAGAGFGYTAATGDAHCLYLQILVEMGILGLLLWGALGCHVLAALYPRAGGSPAMFWLTIALLFASITQETFYPVPAFGGLIGLYLCALALALPRPESRTAESIEEMARSWTCS
jgi:hypothetical protein